MIQGDFLMILVFQTSSLSNSSVATLASLSIWYIRDDDQDSSRL